MTTQPRWPALVQSGVDRNLVREWDPRITDADVNWFEAAQLIVSALCIPLLARLGDPDSAERRHATYRDRPDGPTDREGTDVRRPRDQQGQPQEHGAGRHAQCRDCRGDGTGGAAPRMRASAAVRSQCQLLPAPSLVLLSVVPTSPKSARSPPVPWSVALTAFSLVAASTSAGRNAARMLGYTAMR